LTLHESRLTKAGAPTTADVVTIMPRRTIALAGISAFLIGCAQAGS
jgi:hypothetical protein